MSAKVVGIDVLRWRALARWKAKLHREYLLQQAQAAAQEAACAAPAQKTVPVPPPPAPAKLLPFITAARPSAACDAPRVLDFLTRQEFARRECARMTEAYEQWLLEKWALPAGAPMREPPCSDFGLCWIIEQSLRLRMAQPDEAVAVTTPTPTTRRQPDLRIFFASVIHTPVALPLWRIIKAMARAVHGVFGVLRLVLTGYLLIVTTVAAPFALVERLWWAVAYCAFMAMVFAWSLRAQVFASEQVDTARQPGLHSA